MDICCTAKALSEMFDTLTRVIPAVMWLVACGLAVYMTRKMGRHWARWYWWATVVSLSWAGFYVGLLIVQPTTPAVLANWAAVSRAFHANTAALIIGAVALRISEERRARPKIEAAAAVIERTDVAAATNGATTTS